MQRSALALTAALSSLALALGACGSDEVPGAPEDGAMPAGTEEPAPEPPPEDAATTGEDPAGSETPAAAEGGRGGELTAGERAYLAWVVEHADRSGVEDGDERAAAAEAALAATAGGNGTASLDGDELEVDRVSCWQVPWSGERWSILVTAVDGSWIEMVDSTPEGANAEPYFAADWDGINWTHSWSSRDGEQPFAVSSEGVAGEMTVHAVGESANPARGQFDEAQAVVSVTCS